MKKIKLLASFFILLMMGVCQLQHAQSESTLPKIENYTKGELTMIITPFGSGPDEINIGNISEDGIIHFNWPEIDLNNYSMLDMFMAPVESVFNEGFCNADQKKDSIERRAVKKAEIFLYKYGQAVGSLTAATQKEVFDNYGSNRSTSLVLGSAISWVYCDSDASLVAECKKEVALENAYDFVETTNFNVQFKKGWNLVEHTFIEKEDWKNDTDQGSLPKTRSVNTITQIPENINWHINYWANDEYLEIEQQLLGKTPITKEQYENWVPKKLEKLKRSSYEIGKETEESPTKNNVNIVFEKKLEKVNITIIDCAGDKESATMLTLIKDMSSKPWHNKSESGYSSSKKMGDILAIIVFKEKQGITAISYIMNNRFLLIAESSTMTPERLWGLLEKLPVDNLTY